MNTLHNYVQQGKILYLVRLDDFVRGSDRLMNSSRGSQTLRHGS